MDNMSLNIAHINIGSLNAKFDKIQNFMSVYKWDILAIGETWLTSNKSSSSFEIPGYNLFRHDRKGRSGGVAFYVKSGIKVDIYDKSLPGMSVEYLWIQIEGYEETLDVGVYYRSPSYRYTVYRDAFLREFQNALKARGRNKVVILGDFNIDLMTDSKWPNAMRKLLNTYRMVQLIQTPTNITYRKGKITKTLIDHVIVTKDLPTAKSGTISVERTNHKAVHCTVYFKVKPVH